MSPENDKQRVLEEVRQMELRTWSLFNHAKSPQIGCHAHAACGDLMRLGQEILESDPDKWHEND